MKIFATADWHLGNTFMGQDRLPEQRMFLGWLRERIAAHSPDLLLIAGDIFDNPNPSINAQKAYFDFLGWAMREAPDLRIIIIAGNHDSASRLTMTSPIFHPERIRVVGELPGVWVNASDESPGHREFSFDDVIIPVESRGGEEIAVAAVPYLRPDTIGNRSYSEGVNDIFRSLIGRARELYPARPIVMMAHAFASGAAIAACDQSERIIGGQEEVRLEDWPGHPTFLVCGHIHRAQWLWGTGWARYPGSILPMSIAERNYSHGIDVIDIDPDGSVRASRLTFEPPHRLIVIPDGEAPISPGELRRVIRATLKELPSTTTSLAPYVVVRLPAERINDAEERQKIIELTESNGGLLLSFKPIVNQETITADGTSSAMTTTDDIVNRDPREAFTEAFIAVNKEEPTENQSSLIDEIIKAAFLSETSSGQ